MRSNKVAYMRMCSKALLNYLRLKSFYISQEIMNTLYLMNIGVSRRDLSKQASNYYCQFNFFLCTDFKFYVQVLRIFFKQVLREAIRSLSELIVRANIEFASRVNKVDT